MLNQAQQHAVDYDLGHLLIVAGPGTGKTHTITHRIVRYGKRLQDGQQICAITFTQKASREMGERLNKLSENSDQLSANSGQAPEDKNNLIAENELLKTYVGTFHQLCLQLLKCHADYLPSPIRIASEDELNALAKELWPEMTHHERKNMLERISQAKSHLHSQPFAEWEQYTMVLRQQGLLDYDDLLREAVLMMRKNQDILCAIQKQFPFVFVDEYQDINAMQHDLLCLMIGEQNQLTAIGDPHQAIYGFRGSCVSFFHRFCQDFEGATVITLNENYRSASNLLEASGQVICHDQAFEVLRLTPHLRDQGQLIIYTAPTEKAEAEYVVHHIEKLVGGTSMFSHDSGRVDTQQEGEVTFADIAILYRMNAQQKFLVEALERSGIPYGVAGNKRVEEDPYDIGGERVSLMTLHASKGLEFPIVFIVGCESGLLPLDLEGLATNVIEERRLFYVGMTRAKNVLYLVRAQKRYLYGRQGEQGPSPFLADIEEALKCYEKTKKAKPRPDRLNQMELF